MKTHDEERQILQDVIQGLSVALHKQGKEPEDIGKLALHKLLYSATNHFDLPMDFEYYRYGPMLNKPVVDESFLQPKPLHEIPSPTEPSPANGPYPAPVDYATFFMNDYYRKSGSYWHVAKVNPISEVSQKTTKPHSPFRENLKETQRLAFQAILASVFNSGELSSGLSEEYKKGVRLGVAISIGISIGIPIGALFNFSSGIGIGISTVGVVSHELSEVYNIKKRQEPE